jgi:hypothetical protein
MGASRAHCRVGWLARAIGVKALLAITIGVVCSGCAGGSKEPPEGPRRVTALSGQPMTLEQLDNATRAFADRFVVLVSTGCDKVRMGNPNPFARREAQILKINCASGAYDIATEPDAFTRMLDLLVVATLESQVWIDDGKASREFGDRAQPIIDALRRGRVEAWNMAAMNLPPEQLDVLDYLIWDYRKKNPEAERVAWVRMADFASGRGDSTVAAVRDTSMFAPVTEATKAVDETRQLLDRIFYLLKREPTLVRWQAEGFKDDLIATPEVVQGLDDFHRAVVQFEQIPNEVTTQREAALKALDQRHTIIDESLRTAKDTLTEGNKVATSLNQTVGSMNDLLHSADALMARYQQYDATKPATTEPSRPFDIREYTTTVKEMAVTLDRMNELVRSSNELLASPQWDKRIQEVNDSADGRVRTAADQSRSLVESIFHRVYLALGALLVVLVSYRIIAHLLLRYIRIDANHSGPAERTPQEQGAASR